MTVSHTKYLEAKILSETFEKVGFTILNKKEGNKISLPSMVRDEMDTYFDNMKILLPTMGFELFRPVIQESKQAHNVQDEKLFLEAGGVKAEGRLTSNGLLVLKGSLMKSSTTAVLAPTYLNIRKELVLKGYVKETVKGLVFLQDYEFTSPSQAGAVILGYSVNGRAIWRNYKGKMLKEIEDDQVAAAI